MSNQNQHIADDYNSEKEGGQDFEPSEQIGSSSSEEESD